MSMILDPRMTQSPAMKRANEEITDAVTRTMRAYYGMLEGWIQHAIGCGIPFAEMYRTQEPDGHDRVYRAGDEGYLPLIETWIEQPRLDEYVGGIYMQHLNYRIHPELLRSPWPRLTPVLY